MNLTLTLPLKAIYFDQIVAGTKLREYRLRTPYWERRLVCRAYHRVILTRGYPKHGGIEGATRLTREWRGYELQRIQHPHFGPTPVEVFSIDVSCPANIDRIAVC